ncbi:MAG: type II toxin-antitoxin system VapC family toxin [Verrucomicrobia bacterium]|nr:type II toxin-antitoxin system VapC family toxin [Verrucomicrobiota bacterium]MCH8527499.1 type II toxin-antitoxin system VapC family toxin [Kiritimatiellia bacterium]
MRMALDTNRYRDFCEGEPEAVSNVRRAERVFLPLPVLGELRAGFACGTMARKNEAVLNRFLNESRVRVLCMDEASCFWYARLFKQLREQGTPIPTNDLWIAALVEQHNLYLYTRDRHFKHLPQLPLL